MNFDSPPSSTLAEVEATFSHGQINTIIILERIGGILSLISVFLIFITYWLVKRVRNVQNTFIVFASVANIGASIGSLIAFDGIIAGKDSATCQAQSFLFEMFMQSDPWWSLAMAINVFLVFYFHTSPDAFRKRWWFYCIVCYGGPFAIALVLLLVNNPNHGGRVYGGATIWCWVDKDWDFIRIYTYYMIVWVCIIGSILCYFLVGYHVFRTRNQLRSFSTLNREQKELENVREDDIELRGLPPVPVLPLIPNSLQTRLEMAQQGFYGMVTTEVQVVHSPASNPHEPKLAHLPMSNATNLSFDKDSIRNIRCTPPNQFFSSITTTAPKASPEPSSVSRCMNAVRKASEKFYISDPIKRAYLWTSFLFAISVLVTWIPSSLNRIHSWLQGESPYEFHVATAAVLPLQGLWNGIIFFLTSRKALRAWARERLNGEVAISPHREDGPAISQRPSAPLGRSDTSIDEIDSLAAGSDVELRRVSGLPDKGTASPACSSFYE